MTNNQNKESDSQEEVVNPIQGINSMSNYLGFCGSCGSTIDGEKIREINHCGCCNGWKCNFCFFSKDHQKSYGEYIENLLLDKTLNP